LAGRQRAPAPTIAISMRTGCDELGELTIFLASTRAMAARRRDWSSVTTESSPLPPAAVCARVRVAVRSPAVRARAGLNALRASAAASPARRAAARGSSSSSPLRTALASASRARMAALRAGMTGPSVQTQAWRLRAQREHLRPSGPGTPSQGSATLC